MNFSNASNQKPFFQGAIKAAVWGAVSGAVTFGIGEVARTIGNVYFRFIFQAYAHGFYNGIATELQGGKFIHGFAAGAISSAAATFAGDVLKAGPVGQILAGGVSGGLAAEISGGDFIKGFTTGVIVSAFNHWAHEAAEGGGGGELSENEYYKLSDKNKKEYVKMPKEALVMEKEIIQLNTQTPTGQKIYVSNIIREEIWGKIVYVKNKYLVQNLESFKSLLVDFNQNISISYQTYSYSNSWIRYYGPKTVDLLSTNKTIVNTKIYYSKHDYNSGLLHNYLKLLK